MSGVIEEPKEELKPCPTCGLLADADPCVCETCGSETKAATCGECGLKIGYARFCDLDAPHPQGLRINGVLWTQRIHNAKVAQEDARLIKKHKQAAFMNLTGRVVTLKAARDGITNAIKAMGEKAGVLPDRLKSLEVEITRSESALISATSALAEADPEAKVDPIVESIFAAARAKL